jgi:hypothetical protein
MPDALDTLIEFEVTVDVFSRSIATFVTSMRLEGALFREAIVKVEEVAAAYEANANDLLRRFREACLAHDRKACNEVADAFAAAWEAVFPALQAASDRAGVRSSKVGPESAMLLRYFPGDKRSSNYGRALPQRWERPWRCIAAGSDD